MAYIELDVYSESLEMSTTVSILLPNKINKKLDTLYLLHGYRGYHFDWVKNTRLAKYAEDLNLLIVMPEVNNSYYVNMDRGLDYYTYISKELPLIIDSMFNTNKTRYIAGLSMGGYGAFMIAAKNPKLFKKAISLSGSLDINSVYQIVKEQDKKDYFSAVFGNTKTKMKKHDLYDIFLKLTKQKIKPEFYMVCGTEDFLYKDNEKFYDYIVELGFDCYYETEAGEHNWEFWDKHIKKALDWLNIPEI
jgi:S-formylglutathione hydrolase FrmB